MFEMELLPGDVHSAYGTNVASMRMDDQVVSDQLKGQKCLLAFGKHSRFQ